MKPNTLSLLAFAILGCAWIPRLSAEPQVFFDDFSYASSAQMEARGWTLRTAPGWPGIPGALWTKAAVAFHDDPSRPGNRFLRMTSRTDGPGGGTWQTQICQQRKFKDGTYAARIHFMTDPARGPAGDGVVESFYTISPLIAPWDQQYSECDFEYLPAGGWGANGPALFTTTWRTYSPEPHWKKDNVFKFDPGDKQGWHTLVMQMADGTVTYYIDGRELASHGGRYYPRVLMSINFNLWFINGASLASHERREYQEDIDWVYFEKGRVAPIEVEKRVQTLRGGGVGFKDTVTPPDPALPCPCDT